jgi:hypothetical protein
MRTGRLMITLSLLATFIGPTLADWNQSHVFNPEWPPHARFHDVAGLCMTTGFSLIGLWLLWRKSPDFRVHLIVATAVPILAFASLFIAMLVPGAGVEDHPGASPRVLGLPLGLSLAAAFSGLAVIGYILCRRAQTTALSHGR